VTRSKVIDLFLLDGRLHLKTVHVPLTNVAAQTPDEMHFGAGDKKVATELEAARQRARPVRAETNRKRPVARELVTASLNGAGSTEIARHPYSAYAQFGHGEVKIGATQPDFWETATQVCQAEIGMCQSGENSRAKVQNVATLSSDEYFGIPYSNDMGPAADGSKSNPGKPLPKTTEAIAAATKTRDPGGDETGLKGAAQPPLPLLENDKVVARVRAEEQFNVTCRYTERAVKFIREHTDQPFFLYLPHTAVHFPLYPSSDFLGKSPNGLLGDWAEEVDASVGQVLDAVRERKLEHKTLVIFTSDNGGSLPNGSNNGPLRGSKGQTFEGGIRVGTLAWWPGKIPAGTATDAITTTMDLLPTLVGLADAKLPTDRKLDGVDVRPVLFGASVAPPRQEFLYFRGFRLEAVRQGPWKLHLERPADAPGTNIGKEQPLLFNLTDDVGETKNLAAEHPEIVARLRTVAESTKDDLGLVEIGPGCRPLGRVANPRPLINHDGTVRPDAVGATKQFR
jgi:hypothetical protein